MNKYKHKGAGYMKETSQVKSKSLGIHVKEFTASLLKRNTFTYIINGFC